MILNFRKKNLTKNTLWMFPIKFHGSHNKKTLGEYLAVEIFFKKTSQPFTW